MFPLRLTESRLLDPQRHHFALPPHSGPPTPRPWYTSTQPPRTRKTLITLQQHHNSPACVRAILDGVGATGAHAYCSSSTVRLAILDWASRIQCRTASGHSGSQSCDANRHFLTHTHRDVPSSVESVVRRPPAPPPIAVCVTFLAWEPLGKRPLWTCHAPKILGLHIGLTSNFCSRKMRQIRHRMRHP